MKKELSKTGNPRKIRTNYAMRKERKTYSKLEHIAINALILVVGKNLGYFSPCNDAYSKVRPFENTESFGKGIIFGVSYSHLGKFCSAGFCGVI